jgi:hypothetical protein
MTIKDYDIQNLPDSHFEYPMETDFEEGSCKPGCPHQFTGDICDAYRHCIYPTAHERLKEYVDANPDKFFDPLRHELEDEDTELD